MQPQSSLKRYIIIIAVLTLVLISLSALLYLNKNNLNVGNFQTPKPPSNANPQLFDSQTANLTGKITKINGDKITLENRSGVKGEFKLAQNFLVSDLSGRSLRPAKTEVEKIELNKEAMITLSVVDNEYFVTAIIFTQTAPQANPAQGISGQQKTSTASAVSALEATMGAKTRTSPSSPKQ